MSKILSPKTSREELGTLVKEQVANEISLYAAQQNKKCSSNSDDKEINAIEDLSAFNYKNIDKCYFKMSKLLSPNLCQILIPSTTEVVLV